MKKLVISLGGSVLFPSLESNRLSEYIPLLTDIGRMHQLFVVVGGGGEARRYISVMRKTGIDEATCDEIGILVTRLNASILIAGLGAAAYPAIAETHTEAKEYAESGKIVVMGGITPGQTTDAVSAVLAERCSADLLINATSVDGIYSADPRKDNTAERYKHLTPSQLLEIVSRDRLSAGANTVVDIVAVKVVERSGIPLLVLDGREPGNIERALDTGEFDGTFVSVDDTSPVPFLPAGMR